MQKQSYFIADVHLERDDVKKQHLFLSFLETVAFHCADLYILGDLFEFWLGDDVPSKCLVDVAGALQQLVQNGTHCYFMHGNRDFLLQKNYASLAGVELLPEEHVADRWLFLYFLHEPLSHKI